ncbi:5-azacytidine-induced protein 2 [Bienertia sinuspersici]
MEPSDLSNGSQTLNDVMYRRLKNRERQRRYRQRKRNQTDASNAHVTTQSSHMQIVSLPTNGTVEQFVTRVHCKRDWKKDARRVHAANTEAISNGLSSSGQSLASENNLPHAFMAMREEEQTSKNKAPSENSLGPNDKEKMRSKRRRRDWKAEARNKK